MAMSSWSSSDIPHAGHYSSGSGLQSEQANASLSTDRWMAIRASSLWRDQLCAYRPTVIPGRAADISDHVPIPPTVSEQVKAHEERAVVFEALQPVPQYGARTEHSTILNEPVESVVLSRNIPRQQGSQEAPPQLRAHEYRLVVGGLSIILLHPQQSEDVGVIEAFEPPPRSTWLYEVALKYAGSEPPARARVAIKNSKKRNGSGRFNPTSKKDENKSGEKGVRKGNGETCLVCSSLQKKCPAKLGELCFTCEDAEPLPLPTVYALPDTRTGVKSRIKSLLVTAERTFRWNDPSSHNLHPYEECTLRQVAYVRQYAGNIYFLPSGAFVLG